MESIEKMKSAGIPNLRPGAFAENITTEFLVLPTLAIGTRITIGGNTELEVTQIGKECHSKCAIFYKVGDCVMPKEGIFCKVIRGGEIKLNDEIVVANAEL
jgi:MOSC domain-containing protein YiiM